MTLGGTWGRRWRTLGGDGARGRRWTKGTGTEAVGRAYHPVAPAEAGAQEPAGEAICVEGRHGASGGEVRVATGEER